MSGRITLLRATVLLLASLAARVGAAAPPAESVPPVQFVGHESKVTSPRFVLAEDERSWRELWAEHTGVENSGVPPHRHAAPKIDFSRFMVVGVFLGASTNCDGAPAVAVIRDDGALRVRYEHSTFQTASIEGPDRGVSTTPFGLWVIEKSDAAVVVERGVRRLKNQPIEWRAVHRFERR